MSRRRNNRQEKKSKKVIRCKKKSIPVFESDKCEKYEGGLNKGNEKNCKTCKHSF